MKRLFLFMAIALTGMACWAVSPKKTAAKITPIKVTTPVRPAGQKDVLNLATPKMDVVRVGFIGLGMRGPGAVERWTHLPGVEINALCDLHADRVTKAQNILKKAGLKAAAEYSGSEDAWKKLCERKDIDLVYIATDWVHHASMMIYAMEHGKHVACEVPSVMSLDEIWKVINTSERTRKHCMQLENCVYDFFELTTLNMAQHGVFGDLVHVEGAYLHCLDEFWPDYNDDWRMKYNKAHRGDVYPTHGMGPACQLLNIHRGDRMKYLVSMDTNPISFPAYLKEKRGEICNDFQAGDHTVTMIRTEKGKTIQIQHDVANPRPYSRLYQLTGTKGYAEKYPVEGYAVEGNQIGTQNGKNYENLTAHSFVPDEVKKSLMEKYRNPILTKDLEETAKKVGGHGGMDFIMDYRLVYCLHNGLPLDMDVYDMAEWCCLVPLSAISLDNNFAPVEVPDFTRGGWNKTQGFKYAFAK